jgi:hypothetical protein
MTDQSRGQFPRSNVTGARPQSLRPGSFAVNWADRVIWVGDASGNAVRFSRRVEDYDSSKAYAPDDLVIIGADIWRAIAVIPSGSPFIPGQWQRLSDAGRAEVGQPYASEIYSGGLVTFTPPGTVAVTAGTGVVIDNTDPARARISKVTWSGFSAPVARLGAPWSVLGLNAAGGLVHIPPSAFTPQWRRANITLAYALWSPAGVLLGVRDASSRAGGDAEALRDEYFATGAAYRTAGARIRAVPGGLTLDHTEGSVYALGARWRAASTNPNTLAVAAKETLTLIPVTATGAQGAPVEDVPTSTYDPDGAGAAQPLPADRFVIHYLVSTPDMVTFYLQYGQTAYASKAEALTAVPDDYAQLVKFAPEAILMLLAAVVVERDSATLDEAVILNAAAFGDPFSVASVAASSGDAYLLDGSRPLQGDMDADGFEILNTRIDGSGSELLLNRSTQTGTVPPPAEPAALGEPLVNLPDRKLYVRDAAGIPRLIAQGLAAYAVDIVYQPGDLVILGDAIHVRTAPTGPAGPFEPEDWLALTGASEGLSGAVVTAPDAPLRNRIVPGGPAVEGLVIDGAPTQTADLLSIPGTAASDTGKLAVDALGFPNKRFGASIWRQPQPTHGFTFRGQVAAFTGAAWVLASAAAPTGKAIALVDEIIDANTVVLRSAGRIVDLQAGAFAGGIITPGTLYYVSETVPGQLTGTPPVANRVDPVLRAITATSGVVAIDNAGPALPPGTTVSATPPANPTSGQLWFDTGERDALFIWVDNDGPPRWAPSLVPPPGTFIGPTAPPNPEPGQLWFRTTSPTGLLVWDGTVWLPTTSGQGVPIGTISYFAASAPPQGWLVCDGAQVTPLTPDLRTFLVNNGSPFGSAGGNPLLPDMRGEFIRGVDQGRGVDPGRVFGSKQLDQFQRFVATFRDIQFLGGGQETNGIGRRGAGTNSAIWQGATAVPRNTLLQLDPFFDPTLRSGDETRPRNIALLPCIKASSTPLESEGGTPPQPVTIAAGASGWQVVGDVLVCWGTAITNGANPGNAPVVFPRAFKTPPPSVTATPRNNESTAALGVTCSHTARTTTGVNLIAQNAGGFVNGIGLDWIAVGEALDADKKPKVVGGAGGAGGADFATLAEALAGVRPDAVMSPLTARQADEARGLGWGQSWQNVAAQRAANTTFQNTTGRPIMVTVQPSTLGGGRNMQVSVDGTTWVTLSGSGAAELFVQSAIVPPGHFYRFTGAFGPWAELR